MRGNFCSYDSGEKSIAIYQYCKIDKSSSCKEVAKFIKEDLNNILTKYTSKVSIKKLLQTDKY